MLKQHLFYLGLLTAAVGVPYSASEWKTITRWVLEGGAGQPASSASGANANPASPPLATGWGQAQQAGITGQFPAQFAGYGSDNSYSGVDSSVYNSPFAPGNDATSSTGKNGGSSSTNTRGSASGGNSSSGANSSGSGGNSGNTYSGNNYGGSSTSGNSYSGQGNGGNSYSGAANGNSGSNSSGWNNFGASGNNSEANASEGTSAASNNYGSNNYNSSSGNYSGSSNNSYSSSSNKGTNYGGSTSNNSTGKSNSWGSSANSSSNSPHSGDSSVSNNYGSNYSHKKSDEPASPKSAADKLAEIEPAVKPADICLVGWDEALRFEVTEPWIMQRWNRVNTAVAVDNMRGYRVPLVTGAGEEDLAGALTYYFDQDHLCQRVAFRGTTGDPSKLVMYMSERFGLEAVTSAEPGVHLYQIRWNGRALSELKITPAPVIRASSPHLRYQVEFTLNAR